MIQNSIERMYTIWAVKAFFCKNTIIYLDNTAPMLAFLM